MKYEELLAKLTMDLQIGRPLIPDGWPIWFLVGGIVIALIGLALMLWPIYNVWRSKKAGEAKLAKLKAMEKLSVDL